MQREDRKDGQSGRGRLYNPVFRRIQGALTWAHALVYKASGGRLLGGLGSNSVVLLTTTGRRSGEPRSVPLFAYPDGEDYVVVASNGGTAGHPGWLLNLRSNPEAELRVKDLETAVRATELGPDERDQWWPRVVKDYKLYESYQKKTDRLIPLVRLSPVNRDP